MTCSMIVKTDLENVQKRSSSLQQNCSQSSAQENGCLGFGLTYAVCLSSSLLIRLGVPCELQREKQ